MSATAAAAPTRSSRWHLPAASTAIVLSLAACTAPSAGPTTVTRLPDDPAAASASARSAARRTSGPRPVGALWRDTGSPADELLRAGDGAWAQGELRAADDAYRRAAALERLREISRGEAR